MRKDSNGYRIWLARITFIDPKTYKSVSVHVWLTNPVLSGNSGYFNYYRGSIRPVAAFLNADLTTNFR